MGGAKGRPLIRVFSLLAASGLAVSPTNAFCVPAALGRPAAALYNSAGGRSKGIGRGDLEMQNRQGGTGKTGREERGWGANTRGHFRAMTSMSSTTTEVDEEGRIFAKEAGPTGYKMEYRYMGGSDLLLSKVGFGCMMFGHQLKGERVHHLLDVAFDQHGINWLDTSETFPWPVDPVSHGKADRVLKGWLKTRDRSKIILSTKIAGHGKTVDWLRKDGSTAALTRDQILESVEGSLRRLGTDYIDLLHIGDWPDRYVANNGEVSYYRSKEYDYTPIGEQLATVKELVDQGVVRYVGVSNETPFGVCKFTEHALWDGMPKAVTAQVEYNLFNNNRVDLGMVEACGKRQCDVSMVARTPLGGGGLAVKYFEEADMFSFNTDLRYYMFPGFQCRYNSEKCKSLTLEYQAMAKRYGMTVVELALSWVYNRPHIAATLIGATSEEQLFENVGALRFDMNDDLKAEIDEILIRDREPGLTAAVIDFPEEWALTNEETVYDEHLQKEYNFPPL